jgi:SAM-dependent methyltransferase
MLHHILSMQKLTLVCKALRNKQVVRLFTRVIHASYSLHFRSSTQGTLTLVDDVIAQLVFSQEKVMSISKLKEAGKIGFLKYQNSKNDFKRSYLKYRRQNKVRYEYAQIQKYLVGKKILDFGSGDGAFAQYLAKQGFDVWGTDVKDYRGNNRNNYHFYITDLNIQSKQSLLKFDTTIVKSVFHHIEKEKLEHTLQQIYIETNVRLLIKEDIIVDKENRALLPKGPNGVLSELYLRLRTEEQFEFLALMDYFGNCVVQGLSFINLPFNFNKIGEWKKILAKHKFTIKKVLPVFFDLSMLHPGPHVWLVCEVEK